MAARILPASLFSSGLSLAGSIRWPANEFTEKGNSEVRPNVSLLTAPSSSASFTGTAWNVRSLSGGTWWSRIPASVSAGTRLSWCRNWVRKKPGSPCKNSRPRGVATNYVWNRLDFCCALFQWLRVSGGVSNIPWIANKFTCIFPVLLPWQGIRPDCRK